MAEVCGPVKDEEDVNEDESGASKMDRALSFIDLKLTHFVCLPFFDVRFRFAFLD